MSELRDRLEALATRGTRRGADDVLKATQHDAQANGSDHGPTVAISRSSTTTFRS